MCYFESVHTDSQLFRQSYKLFRITPGDNRQSSVNETTTRKQENKIGVLGFRIPGLYSAFELNVSGGITRSCTSPPLQLQTSRIVLIRLRRMSRGLTLVTFKH